MTRLTAVPEHLEATSGEVRPARGGRDSAPTERAEGYVLLVASHGGHLSELLDLVPYDGSTMFLVTYESRRTQSIDRVMRLPNIGLNPLRLLATFLRAVLLVSRRRPQLIISTGSEIAIAFFIVARLWQIPTIYIESCTRVKTPTRTGRLVYFFADRFLVQSEVLVAVYGDRAIYRGSLV